MQPDMQLLGAQFFHRARLPERRLRQPLETDYIGIKVVVRLETERLLPGERLGDAFHPSRIAGRGKKSPLGALFIEMRHQRRLDHVLVARSAVEGEPA